MLYKSDLYMQQRFCYVLSGKGLVFDGMFHNKNFIYNQLLYCYRSFISCSTYTNVLRNGRIIEMTQELWRYTKNINGFMKAL